jgi:hypothetical protein
LQGAVRCVSWPCCRRSEDMFRSKAIATFSSQDHEEK